MSVSKEREGTLTGRVRGLENIVLDFKSWVAELSETLKLSDDRVDEYRRENFALRTSLDKLWPENINLESSLKDARANNIKLKETIEDVSK